MLELIDEYSKNATTTATEEALRSMSMLRKLREEKADLERKLEKASKWEAFFKKAAPYEIVALSLIGFMMGVVLAVAEMLKMHGPTVTLSGTIGAFGIYVLTGAFFAWTMGILLGKEIAKDNVALFRERGEELWNRIEEVDWKIRHCTHYSD